jgi:hypothetical protein
VPAASTVLYRGAHCDLRREPAPDPGGGSEAAPINHERGSNQPTAVSDAAGWNYCGDMRLRTDTAASAASLADYLRRCECVVEVIDGRIIDATARPQSFAAPHADVELDGYLTVWQAMHPESLIERLTPLARP